LGDLNVDVKIILDWILEKQGVKMWTGFIWLRTGQWQALMNTTMNRQVPLKVGNFLIR
jgi:hypothetical protein